MNHLDRLQDMLAKLHFVRWDRFTHPVSDEYHCYGWIRTKDHPNDSFCGKCGQIHQDRADFVVLTFWDDYEKFWWVTSSVEYSKQIGEIVDGDTYEHVDCQRIEHLFPTLDNAIKL